MAVQYVTLRRRWEHMKYLRSPSQAYRDLTQRDMQMALAGLHAAGVHVLEVPINPQEAPLSVEVGEFGPGMKVEDLFGQVDVRRHPFETLWDRADADKKKARGE